MIKSFRHKGLANFFYYGSTSGIQNKHVAKLRLQLTALDSASGPEGMNVCSWRLHPLKGDLAEHWSVSVNGHWRLTFFFIGKDAFLVDYQNYH
ncbi:type II toxin-antitoxin system RelE/ParE family toxin [Edaphovirga cremea]|jgi:proteic killer suppression protein|uniref:type II toxin-antitoxin system RelE/ParE family toxin n=1 Tax=Edaphovirga cremea TaxID=2267246 RepID=UPI000DEF9346|nr:type II toxin-antitoxin system RelE/ParE family toxin [Edaphovirga cremea]